MAVIQNPRERIEYTPPDQIERPEAERVVYTLKVPTYWDRIAINRAVAARGGRQHSLARLHGRIRAGLAAAFSASNPSLLADAERLLVALEAEQARGVAFLSGNPDLSRPETLAAFQPIMAARQQAEQAVSGLYDQFASIDADFGAMLGDNAVYHDVAAGVLIQHLLLDWRGLPVPCRRSLQGLDASLLDYLAAERPKDVALLYQRLNDLRAPSEAEAGNSESPSTGSGDMPNSAMAETASEVQTSP